MNSPTVSSSSTTSTRPVSAGRCRAALRHRSASPGVVLSRRRAPRGHSDAEARTLRRGALDDDVPAVLVDDAVHHREAHAGALAGLLRREERLEDALEDLRAHAVPVVLDDQLDEWSVDRADGSSRTRGLRPAVGARSMPARADAVESRRAH